MGSGFLRPFLQTLCCNSPWNYAVFWKLKHQDEMILAWEDGFCDIPKSRDAMVSPAEDLYFRNSNTIFSSAPMPNPTDGTPGDYLIEFAVAEMSRSSHVVGKGVVGEAAFKGNARWIYSDNIKTDVLDSILAAKHPEEWLLQFAAGIKTILLLPVIPDGVLQLGSMEMVAEDAALAVHVKNKFDAHKESDGCFQQFSLMSTFMDYLDEPSTFTTAIEDHNSIDAVEDHHLIANQMVPVFMFQDFCNSSERHGSDNLEYMGEREFDQLQMGMIHAPEPFQSSFADLEDEISKFIHEERLRASPHCHELNRRMCGSLANELMDYGFDEGAHESTFLGNGFDDAICDSESNLFNFSEAFELSKALGSVVESIVGEDVVEFPVEQVEREHLSKTVANASNSFDDNSSEKSNVTSINMSSRGFSKRRGQSKYSASIKEDRVPSNVLISESTTSRIDTKKKFSASVSSVESKISSLSDKQQARKEHKLSRLSKTCKKREHGSDNHKPRPRDRQLIQDRIKELRDLVPNSEKCSIDGLLDKTIKHMLFLRNVTDQADKLRHPILEEEVDENTTKPAEGKCNHQDGTSWVVELGSEKNFCPIVVKDLDQPRHMLIEMVCSDHDRFLEIADVIHRLKLTILKGVMEKATDNSSWARFIVETSGSFHRLDIFWPLMQLQKDGAPI